MSLDKNVLRTVTTEGKENIVPYVSTYNHRDPKIFSVINENMPSKKKGNDQEVIQSPTSLPRPKGKEGHTQNLTNAQKKTRTVNRMNSSFSSRWSFSYPN